MQNQNHGCESSPEDVFVRFMIEHCRHDLIWVLQQPDFERHYGIVISITRLAVEEYGVVEVLLSSPKAILPVLDAALVHAQRKLLPELLQEEGKENVHNGTPGQGSVSNTAMQSMIQYPMAKNSICSVKENVHARLIGISTFLDRRFRRVSPGIDDIGAAYIDRLITVRGTVVRTGEVKLLQSRLLYECGRCKYRFVVEADLEAGATVQLPNACPSRKEKPCNGTNFRHCEEVALYTNFQEITLQDRDHFMESRATTRSLIVLLQDDLAESCLVGDLVEITGIVVRQYGPMYPGIRLHIGLALQATAVVKSKRERDTTKIPPEKILEFQSFWEKHSQKPFSGRDLIISSICPQLCGLFTVKMASLLMLIGGVSKDRTESSDLGLNVSGIGTRGEIHFLLVGDPGTGKSQFQKYISQLAPRSVITSGSASSAAGLTAAAVKDGAQWTLEAGALVLSDGGVCCIDEFDSVKEADRASLHEAMEQQTVSIAKAGLVTTLHTRTSVFGTCNPKGHKRYNTRRPLAEQLNISGPLLSRFDIVLLLLDDINPNWDESIADHILNLHQQHSLLIDHNKGSPGFVSEPKALSRQDIARLGTQQRQTYDTVGPTTANNASMDDNDGMWSLETLKEYIAWVKFNINPVLSPQAEEILRNYYQLRRRSNTRHAARTTIRLLESLVRLAQAHAKLMAKEKVEVSDAVMSVALIDDSVVDGDAVLDLPSGVGLCGPGNTFLLSPDECYKKLEVAVIRTLREGLIDHALPGAEIGMIDWHEKR